jgi:hypothetical protein
VRAVTAKHAHGGAEIFGDAAISRRNSRVSDFSGFFGNAREPFAEQGV